MPLHPRIVAALKAAENFPEYHTLPVDQARAFVKRGYPPRVPPIAVGQVEDRAIPGPAGPLPVRIYWPNGAGPHPVLVFFHGSGFVLLDLDSHDDFARRLCRGGRCIVVSVDYRLAPEHRFPAAPDDCLAATRWIVDHAPSFGGDPSRLAVAGDSAGACLAIVTALRMVAEGGPALRGQLLYYPVTDYPDPERPSYRAFAQGYGLTARGMGWFWDHYLPSPDYADHAWASPLRAPSFAGLPPACVVTAEYDVLRDEGERYAQALLKADIAVTLRRGDGLNHGFLRWVDEIPAVADAVETGSAWLRGVFGP